METEPATMEQGVAFLAEHEAEGEVAAMDKS
jgi:hypothetical protein